MYRPAILTGIITAALAVMLGAFGAHGLKSVLAPDQLAIYGTGVTYQFYHSLALVSAGLLHMACPHKAVRISVPLFVAGMLFFCGSLYLMVALSTAGKSIGAAGIITPVGGLCFIGGWLALLIGVLKNK